MKQFETERLILRPWRESDFEDLANFFSSEEDARFVGGVKNKEQSWRLMATYLGHLELRGYSIMAVERKDTNQLAGGLGLWNSTPWPELELGYWFVPAHQKQGFAAEAGRGMIQHAFENLNLQTFVSYIHPDNEPSKKLSERLGGKFEKMMDLLDFGEHCVYRYKK